MWIAGLFLYYSLKAEARSDIFALVYIMLLLLLPILELNIGLALVQGKKWGVYAKIGLFLATAVGVLPTMVEDPTCGIGGWLFGVGTYGLYLLPLAISSYRHWPELT